MSSVTLFSPAKVNLFLAITGRRSDGFHNLVSVAAPLDWGDRLEVKLAEETVLSCDDQRLPVDESNLVWKAMKAFREATGWTKGVEMRLEKRIPMGAGLGGGSSNAVATLRALNQLSGDLLDQTALQQLAAEIGADCALFLENAPVIMRGKGEKVERLDEETRTRLTGQRVLVFKPPFGISTPWAYGQMAARPQTYLPEAEAEAKWETWQKDRSRPLEELFYNSMESVVFSKYPALPTLYDMIKTRFGCALLMSGSGSASLIHLKDDQEEADITEIIREMWGEEAFMVATTLA